MWSVETHAVTVAAQIWWPATSRKRMTDVICSYIRSWRDLLMYLAPCFAWFTFRYLSYCKFVSSLWKKPPSPAQQPTASFCPCLVSNYDYHYGVSRRCERHYDWNFLELGVHCTCGIFRGKVLGCSGTALFISLIELRCIKALNVCNPFIGMFI